MKLRLAVIGVLFSCLLPAAPARVWYVKAGAAGDGSAWGAAAPTLTAAIQAASSGDEVWAAGGVYSECITLKDGVALYGGFAGGEAALAERSITLHPSVIYGCDNAAVSVPAGAGRGAVLDGFTVRSSTIGISSTNASPTLANITIEPVVHWTGTGIFITGGYPIISGSEISGISTGIWCVNTMARITGSFIADCRDEGVAVSGGSVDVWNNTFRANMDRDVSVASGGMAVAANNVSIRGATFMAMELGTATVVNNTIVESGSYAVNVSGGAVTAANNIMAYGCGGVYVAPAASVALNNNCIWPNGGYDYVGIADPTGTRGNLRADPKLAAPPTRNIHIQPGSPCRDAGSNAAALLTSTDIDGQPRLIGGSVDIGADESDGTACSILPAIVRVRPDGNDSNDGSSWALAKKTVQAALDAAEAGEVWAAAGTYTENVTLWHTRLLGGFRGDETRRDDRDPRANVTVLDGARKSAVVFVQWAADRSAVIDGFTIRNGNASHGGGIWCWGGSRPTITNNIIRDNAGVRGGGVMVEVYSDPLIMGNVIRGNSAAGGGGIEFWTSARGSAVSNLIIGNTANYGSAVLLSDGGDALIVNNTIVGNTQGSAVQLWGYTGLLANNVIAFNSSGVDSQLSIEQARHNCLWGNVSGDGASIVGLNGNLAADPRFVDRALENYRLAADSPCIDGGLDTAVFANALDLDGKPRLLGLHVDIGAYETGNPPYTVADAAMALRLAAGLRTAPDVSRWNIEPAGGSGVNIVDAVRILRRAVWTD
ncbi:MAG TPA: right-handed parallel beta-helix repeat-containing protein [Armatimonadota bacterium]|jgi:hypothetical protein